MLKEYIDREALMNAIPKPWAKDEKISQWGAVMDCIVIATSIPAADVAPVVHSEWINHSGGNATCRRCGVRQRAVYDDDNDQNFCGHCGAKMDGGKK